MGSTTRSSKAREFTGHTYKVYVKNENIVGWLDGDPDAMSPD